MDYKQIYKEWLNNEDFDAEFRAELAALTDEKEIEDRFYKPLSFGTAGMRGVLGAGLNRMNKYNVRKATHGFAQFLLSKAGESVVIAHDNRRMSKQFCKEAASVFAANGLKVFVFEDLRTTPELSFAVRYLKTDGGVVVTASHNPPEYNGYKVYGSNGSQLMPIDADVVTANVEAITDFSEIPYIDYDEALVKGMVEVLSVDVDSAFLEAVKKQIIHKDAYKVPFKVAYSPMHGTGAMIIERLMNELSVSDMVYEPSQMKADTEFSTVNQPNPEEEQAFGLLKKLGEKENADMLIGTDPDCDRVGVMLRKDGKYVKLSGNEVGTLLTNYILTYKELPAEPYIVKTVVTSDLCVKIAKAKGVEAKSTFTGFKHIGDEITKAEKAGKGNFVFGYEESIGYLAGMHARDKDGVVSVMLIVEMAKFYHQQGKSLFVVLDEIQSEYGYHSDHLIAKVLKGKTGMEKIANIIAAFRAAKGKIAGLDIIAMEDFQSSVRTDMLTGAESTMDFPKSNVLKYYMKDGSWLALRPSGTEPKLKFYISALDTAEQAADNKRDSIIKIVEDFIAEYI